MECITTSQKQLTNIIMTENHINNIRKHYLSYDVNLINKKYHYKNIDEVYNKLNNGRFCIDYKNTHFECFFL